VWGSFSCSVQCFKQISERSLQFDIPQFLLGAGYETPASDVRDITHENVDVKLWEISDKIFMSDIYLPLLS